MLWLGFQCSDHTGAIKLENTVYDPIFAHTDNGTAHTNSGLQTQFRWVLFFFLRAEKWLLILKTRPSRNREALPSVFVLTIEITEF